jgi:hypothetical protein
LSTAQNTQKKDFGKHSGIGVVMVIYLPTH